MRDRASTQDVPQQIVGHGHLSGNDDWSSELPLSRALSSPAIHPAIHRALGALERSGACWALLRGESELASTSGDVDLLVATDSASLTEAELDRARAELGGDRKVEIGAERLPRVFDLRDLRSAGGAVDEVELELPTLPRVGFAEQAAEDARSGDGASPSNRARAYSVSSRHSMRLLLRKNAP